MSPDIQLVSKVIYETKVKKPIAIHLLIARVKNQMS